ncbi:AAA family ATPase [Haloglomus irregulare]|uniref:DNA helicase n=1 Tax=Haloglomus irregulare TaxID=2234134 RepID=A0A554NEI9_9EURY|nr:AAA domain-containing protein [Haloglomus irregulare]TSD15817.1 AAA family ATPase [Haloglomus irregulare]
MNVRGPVVDVGETRTVSGGTELAEVTVRPERGAGAPTQVTLWRKWAESADYLEPGMELLVTDVETDEWQGETQYATTPTSWVVVEPDFLVDVTGIRAWVQCPRMYYLNKLQGVPLKYPVVKGTVVHEVFGDLLRGGDLDEAVENRVADAALDIGLLGLDADEVAEEVRANAAAIEAWLQQGTLTETDSWRSEQTLISETFGIKGRADAVRRGAPVELKTGKNTKGEPRFQDKVQAACYALLLGEFADAGAPAADGGAADAPIDGGGETAAAIPDTGTLIYTKNAALDRSEASGDLSPAKDFSIGRGFAEYVLRERNHLAAMEHDHSVPTGYEAEAKCEYCFEQDPCMAVAGRLEQEAKAGAIPGIAVPDEEQAYFDRFYRAIEAERREVHREYRKLWEQSARERADDDRALVDLEPAGRERRADGRWVLRAHRPGEAVSKIREGDLVLASEGHPTRTKAELARVESLGGADDAVVLTADEPLDVRRLDVYPSELTVDRQLNALHDAILAGDEERKDVLFGRREPAFRDEHGTYIDNNAAQDEAVNLALNAEDFALVHGPPGTGKTYTLATLVRALVERGERVLLSAFTNRAVDNALEALREQGFEDVLRVGSESGVRADMHEHLLDETGDPDRVAGDLREAPVVAATTASCGSRAVKSREFDVAVVDEAGQLTEPGTFLATNRADRFVLVGDHQQLPPVVRAENDLRESLFERLIEAHPDAGVMLTRQYRMSQRVQWFASEEFYDGELRPATPEVAGQRLGDLPGVNPGRLPESLRDAVSFVDPDGRQVGNTNPAEADAVADAVRSYLDAGVAAADIGVIAPFRAQVAEIGKRLDGTGVTVDTVDRFQGSAKEVIVVSVVATGTVESPVFEDHRRMNVALTRAKKAVALVGDRDALESDAFYRRLLRWAEG